MCNTGKRYRYDLLERINHHGFERERKIWGNLMTITQQLTRKCQSKKARLMILVPSSKGKEISPKRATSFKSLITGSTTEEFTG
jgi:hypothetical protein